MTIGFESNRLDLIQINLTQFRRDNSIQVGSCQLDLNLD